MNYISKKEYKRRYNIRIFKITIFSSTPMYVYIFIQENFILYLSCSVFFLIIGLICNYIAKKEYKYEKENFYEIEKERAKIIAQEIEKEKRSIST